VSGSAVVSGNGSTRAETQRRGEEQKCTLSYPRVPASLRETPFLARDCAKQSQFQKESQVAGVKCQVCATKPIPGGLGGPGLGVLYKQSQFPAVPGGSRPEGRGPWGSSRVFRSVGRTNKPNFRRPGRPGAADCAKQSQFGGACHAKRSQFPPGLAGNGNHRVLPSPFAPPAWAIPGRSYKQSQFAH